ncbi:MAG: AAA family ATPase, partial [Hyphomicrobiaceae bacterium]|nr:AAA family ATPase [Hyphomicrobiaceae bacterium]
ISILRGLKEKYELHHGVRITDAAIVSASVLSNRYITNRFLPDKAIDLMDEAASRLRMQIDSKPEELDEMDRHIVRLKIEREALLTEGDAVSKDRLNILTAKISELDLRSNELTRCWQAEKRRIGEMQKIKEELDALRTELEQAQRRGDLARAGELSYGIIPGLVTKISDLEKADNNNSLIEETVTRSHIAQVVCRWTAIPVDRIIESECEKLLRMEDELQCRVIGQNEAVVAVSTAVKRARAGLQDFNRPIGSFMFLGPTGVGKTELSKALASFMFDDSKAMVRLDMSEYKEKHSVARLIGAPPGYIGYEEGGLLTEPVRQRPYQLVLFDEIEKAHSDIWNILLQVLDDGRLTDGQGRTVDFSNTLILMTSNIGADHIISHVSDKDINSIRECVLYEVRLRFRPEFLNRLDDIIVFERLKREDMTKIVDIQLKWLTKLLVDRKITLKVDDLAKQWLADRGYDPKYGARPLKRVIQKYLQDQLAQSILSGTIRDNETVFISVIGKNISINNHEVK